MKNKFATLLFVLAGLSAFSQTEDRLPDSEVEVIKSFKARLDEAQMLGIKLVEDHVESDRSFINEYKLSAQPIKLEYPDPQMKPLAMPVEENPSSNPLYVKLGYGLQNNPLAELAYSLNADRLKLQSRASYESMRDLNNRNKKFTDIDVLLAAEYELTDLLLLHGDVSFLNQKRGLYATDISNDQDESEFTFNVPKVHFGLKNSMPTKLDIDYSLDYTFRHTGDNFDNKETNHRFEGQAIKNLKGDDFRIGARGSAEFNTLKNSDKSSLNNYILGLFTGYHDSRWNIKAGVDFAFLDGDIKILPQGELFANIKPLVRPFIGVRSDVKQNNFYSLTRDNPYLIRDFNDAKNEVSTEFYGGVRGEEDRGWYELQVGYELAQDKALFVNDFPDTTTFRVLYDDVNTFSFAAKAEIIPIENWTAGVDLTFYGYNTDNEKKAWHLPGFEWNIYAGYNELLNKRLHLKARLGSLSGIKYEDANGESQKIKAQFNFDILADYHINDRLDAFLNLNNLFNNENERYFAYDRIGINPQAGIKFRM